MVFGAIKIIGCGSPTYGLAADIGVSGGAMT
jgi:hypothetical protein